MSSRTYPYECGHKLPMAKFYVRLRKDKQTFHAFCEGCVPQAGHRLDAPGSNWQEITQAEWSYKEVGLAADVKPLFAHEPLKRKTVAAKVEPSMGASVPHPLCQECAANDHDPYVWVADRGVPNANGDVFPEGTLDIGSMKHHHWKPTK